MTKTTMPLPGNDFIGQMKEEKIRKQIYSLQIHEYVSVNVGIYTFRVIRVPGGWIYANNDNMVFVPFSAL